MTFEFRPAVRESVGLLISLASPSGAGKTMSAMKLAKGICGDEPFAVIDTEARRSLHYADMFKFDFVDLKPPFSPDAYTQAISVAEQKGYKAIITDSMSHEHAGEGGVLDWQEEELNSLIKQAINRGDNREEWKLRDAYNQLSWQKPKKAHKRMVDKFLQCRAHLIFCLRAEDKIEFKKDAKGKTIVQPKETLSGYKGWIPICDKRFLFELTASFILLPDKPGVPIPIKLQEQHRPFFPLDQPISEQAGVSLAAWARGATVVPPAIASRYGDYKVNLDDWKILTDEAKRQNLSKEAVIDYVKSLGYKVATDLQAKHFERVKAWVCAGGQEPAEKAS